MHGMMETTTTCSKILFLLIIFSLLPTTSSASSSARLAAKTLSTKGYSLLASVILSLSITNANYSGTILAPPDFAFSSSASAALFLNNRRSPPRPSIALLLYHTLKPPLILPWPALFSLDHGQELRTLYNHNCLFIYKSPRADQLTISSSPLINNPFDAVRIRHPNLYTDRHLTVHGIDGVLDPSYATKCTAAYPHAPQRRVNQIFIDHAIRRLRWKGYSVVAAAMAVTMSEMLSLPSVTLLAVSDKNLFRNPGSFRYDFAHHVVPRRHRILDLGNETQLLTLSPDNKTIVVHSVGSVVTVDGVPVNAREVYCNKWIVVLSITTSLDDVVQINDRVPADSPANVICNLFRAPPGALLLPGGPESPIPSIAAKNCSTNSTELFSFEAPPPNMGDYIDSPPPYSIEPPEVSPSPAVANYGRRWKHRYVTVDLKNGAVEQSQVGVLSCPELKRFKFGDRALDIMSHDLAATWHL